MGLVWILVLGEGWFSLLDLICCYLLGFACRVLVVGVSSDGFVLILSL